MCFSGIEAEVELLVQVMFARLSIKVEPARHKTLHKTHQTTIDLVNGWPVDLGIIPWQVRCVQLGMLIRRSAVRTNTSHICSKFVTRN